MEEAVLGEAEDGSATPPLITACRKTATSMPQSALSHILAASMSPGLRGWHTDIDISKRKGIGVGAAILTAK